MKFARGGIRGELKVAVFESAGNPLLEERRKVVYVCDGQAALEDTTGGEAQRDACDRAEQAVPADRRRSASA
jgi:hypothetical protein